MEIIKNVERVTAGLLSSEPPSSHNISFVYKNAKGEYALVENGAQLPRLELRANRYTIRCSVARGAYTYYHKNEYPSRDAGKTFRVSIQFSVFAEDPIKVVKYDVVNITDYINNNISYWIAPILMDYTIEDFREVQQLFKNLEEKTNLLNDLSERGFSVKQIQASVGLSDSDWSHFKQMEEMKKQQEIEKRKIQEHQELEKLRIEQEKELTKMQAEMEEIKKQNELLLKEREIESAIRLKEKEIESELLIEKKKNEQTLRENEILLEKLRNESDLGRTILTSESLTQVNQTIQKEMENKKELQNLLIRKFLENGDFSDPEVVTKMMGAINEVNTSSSSKQIAQDAPPQKKLSWGGKKEEQDLEKNTVPTGEEWE